MHLAQYAERFPDVQFVIDHCGAVFDAPRGQATIDDAVAMARYPNVACKWAHAASLLSTVPYPFPDLEPKLRRAVDAFGPQRVMWASDYTMARAGTPIGARLYLASGSALHYPRTRRPGCSAAPRAGFSTGLRLKVHNQIQVQVRQIHPTNLLHPDRRRAPSTFDSQRPRRVAL